jgi:hypothetical protein
VIEHRPYGIDDPYKRLASERSPARPRGGRRAPDRLPHGALRHRGVGDARARRRASERHPALPLAAGLWTALLPALPGGAYGYTIHATDGDGVHASPRFDLDVARRRRADRVAGRGSTPTA